MCVSSKKQGRDIRKFELNKAFCFYCGCQTLEVSTKTFKIPVMKRTLRLNLKKILYIHCWRCGKYQWLLPINEEEQGKRVIWDVCVRCKGKVLEGQYIVRSKYGTYHNRCAPDYVSLAGITCKAYANISNKIYEVEEMVRTTTTEGLDEIDGTCTSVAVEKSGKIEDLEQYHIMIKPTDSSILKESKTGHFHEWIRISPKTTDESVPEGSVIHRYIQEIESLFSEAKKLEMVEEVFHLLVGKRFVWKRKQLGRSYKGFEASDYWCPTKLV